jgi:hypothetical protein
MRSPLAYVFAAALVVAPLFAADAPAAAASVAPIPAPRGRASPHETINLRLGGNSGKGVVIVYGRPNSRPPRGGDARKIWGGLVPYGQVWRLGSDEATLLIAEAALDIGGTTVPAGAYSLHMLPVENGVSKLIINKRIGQWGIPYNVANEAANELARVDLKQDTISSQVDQLTFALESVAGATPPAATLRIQWETTQFSVRIALKP